MYDRLILCWIMCEDIDLVELMDMHGDVSYKVKSHVEVIVLSGLPYKMFNRSSLRKLQFVQMGLYKLA